MQSSISAFLCFINSSFSAMHLISISLNSFTSFSDLALASLNSASSSIKLQFSASIFLTSTSSTSILASLTLTSFLKSSCSFSIRRLANYRGSTSTFFSGMVIAFTLFFKLPKVYQNLIVSPSTEICQKLCMKQSKISTGSSKILMKSFVSYMYLVLMTSIHLPKETPSSTLISSEPSSGTILSVIWYSLYRPENPSIACTCQSFIDPLQITINMQQESPSCKNCNLANYTFNEIFEHTSDYFLICQDRHVLCEKCFYSYTSQSNNTCPFDNNPILRLGRPVKAYKLGQETILINTKAQEVNTIDEEIKELVKKIDDVREKKVQLAEELNPELREKNDAIDRYIRTRKQIEEQKIKLQVVLQDLESARIKRHTMTLFAFDALFFIIILTSTIFQLVIISTSFGTKNEDILSFAFYFVSLALTVILLNIRLLLQTLFYLLPLLFLFPFFYLLILLFTPYKRWQIYTKQPNVQPPLPFSQWNYCFFICKAAIFLQFFVRYYNITSTEFYSLVFAFAILEVLALIGLDVSYNHLMRHRYERVSLNITQ